MSNPGQQRIQGVSVVITTYNRAHCVMDAVRSAVEQEPAPLEVLVVDDGSTDGTRELLQKVSSPLVRCHFQANQGLSAARNTGLGLARGDLVAFLDDDDQWLPGKLAAQVPVMRRDDDCVLVYTDMHETWQGEIVCRNVLRQRGYEHAGEGFVYENLLHESFIIPSGAMARTEAVLEAGGFDVELRSSEDRDLWLRLAEVGPMRFVDAPLFLRSRDPGGLTGDLGRWMRNQLAMFGKHRRRRETVPLGPMYAGREKAIRELLVQKAHVTRTVLGQHSFRARELAQARRLLRQCLTHRLEAANLKYYLAAHLSPAFLDRLQRLRDSWRRLRTGAPWPKESR
jgi:GT2 family glycosyltransferase